MKAYARIDGVVVAVAWTASFALYVAASPAAMMGAGLLAALSPFLCARRVARFRDAALGGKIGFGRAWGYAALAFFYAALLFAVAQLAYFQLLDHGRLLGQVEQALADPAARAAIAAYGAQADIDEALATLARSRPIDIALSYLPMNIAAGLALAVPIAAWAKK